MPVLLLTRKVQAAKTACMDLEPFIRRLHDTPHRFVLAATGGGSAAFSHLLTVPGASRTVLEATVPYASAALVEWLGARPESFCSLRTARLMAMAGYRRGLRLAEAEPLLADAPVAADSPVAGVGCTCSLASDRKKRGPHRAHLAVQTAQFTETQSLDLVKDQRTRKAEEELVARWMLNVVAEVSGIEERLELGLLPGERIEVVRTNARPAWQGLLSGAVSAVWHRGTESGPLDARPRAMRGLFPGAFNPRHEGHDGMHEVAERLLAGPVDCELSVTNVDKPSLDFTEMAARLALFSADHVVWLTRAPTFVEKSRLFPGVTFVVGADTITRIGEPRYYGGDPAARDRAIAEIAGAGCRFLVFGRQTEQRFETLDALVLPAALRSLCTGVAEADFREDISSTELRRRDA